jgi:hypothetical protein
MIIPEDGELFESEYIDLFHGPIVVVQNTPPFEHTPRVGDTPCREIVEPFNRSQWSYL